MSIICSSFLLLSCELISEPPLRIHAHLWPGYEFLFLADQEGWLDTQKIQLLETESALDSLQALKLGLSDGAALTLDEVIRARSQGIDLTVVLLFNVSAGADMLLVKKNIKHISDLKGRRIGVEKGALGDLMLMKALESGGLKLHDIQEVHIEIQNHVQAWNEDELDAMITYQPNADFLLKQGARRLFDSRQIPNTIIDVLAIRTEVLERRSSEVRHLIKAHFKALNHFQKNLQDASYRMSARFKIAPEQVAEQYKGLLLLDLMSNKRLMQEQLPTLKASSETLSKVMFEASLIQRANILEGLFKPDYLPYD